VKALFWFLVVSAVAVGLTLVARHDTGYVLFVVPPYRAEVSLNLLVAALAMLFFALYLLTRLAAAVLRLPAEVRALRERSAREQARARLLEGLKAFFEERYARAEKAAADALERGEEPAISAVVAARSAHELRRFEDRDRYLAAAAAAAPGEQTLRLMSQARLLCDERRFLEALQALQALQAASRRPHTGALRLELKVQQNLGNWERVLALLEQLEKRHAFDAALVRELRRHAIVENLKSRAFQKRELEEYWGRLPASDRRDAKVAAAGARSFVEVGDCAAAHAILEQALEAEWNPELLALYGECLGGDVLKQIERAEFWLERHPDDAGLLLTLGKLCAHQQLWGKAQSYLEASVSVAPTREAHVALARLAERLGRDEEARAQYRRSLDFCE
jgi:HemY protein